MPLAQKAPHFFDFSFKTDEVQELDDGKTARIIGLAAGFGNKDSWNEIIEPGAFVKTMKTNPNWAVLRHHDPSIKIGFNENPSEVPKGLRTESVISLETQPGREQVALSKLAHSIEKAKDALSIGFNVVNSRVEDIKKERVKFLETIEMWEHSFVTWGANGRAESTGFKSWLPTEQSGYGLGEYVDDFFKFMESLKYDAKDVKQIMLKEENEKNAATELLNLMHESANLFQLKN